MTTSAATRGVRGGGVSLAGQGMKLVLQVLGTVVLSRLLSPADFGIVAMVSVFVALGEMLRDFGLATAALQRPMLTPNQSSNLFWVNTALGGLVGTLLVLCGPLLVMLYNEARVQDLLPAMAAVSLVNGMQAQIQVHMVKAMRFVALALTDVAAQVAAYATGITCALLGLGYRALIAQAVMGALVQLGSRWALIGWRPLPPQRGHGTMLLVRSGAHFGLANFLAFLSSNTDTLVIGARWGSIDLGFYNRAFQLLMSPVARLVAPLAEVAIPSLHGSITERRNIQDLLLRAQSVIGLALVAVFMTLATGSRWLVPWVLGGQWVPSVQIFNILAVGGCVWGLSNVSLWAFVVLCDSVELLRYNLITKSGTIILVVLASGFGVEAVAWAYSVSLLLSWPINVWWLDRKVGLSAPAFLLNGASFLIPAAISYLTVHFLLERAAGALPDVAMASASMVIVATLYLGLIGVTRRGRQILRGALSDGLKVIR